MNPESPENQTDAAEMPENPMKEEAETTSEGTTAEEMERYEAWMQAHPEKEIASEDRRSHEREADEFIAQIEAFHAEFSVESLHAILHLTGEEAASHPLWQPAKRALASIEPALKKLGRETDIPEDKLANLQAMYKKISQAVGMRRTSDGAVFHDR